MNKSLEEWKQEVSREVNTNFHLSESEYFCLLVPHDYEKSGTRLLHESAERTFLTLSRMLKGIVPKKRGDRFRIVLFDNSSSYKQYLLSHYPNSDIESVSPEGTLVQSSDVPPHIALPQQDLGLTESVIAHELTRLCLSPLRLPVWIEEGIALLVEHELTGLQPPPIDPESLKKLREYWSPENSEQFWSGAGFYEVGDISAVCRATAELIIYAILKQYSYEQFRDFVQNAKYEDSGDQSAANNLGLNLGDIFVGALGIQSN